MSSEVPNLNTLAKSMTILRGFPSSAMNFIAWLQLQLLFLTDEQHRVGDAINEPQSVLEVVDQHRVHWRYVYVDYVRRFLFNFSFYLTAYR